MSLVAARKEEPGNAVIVTAIIQARMGSTRLPGKVLEQLAGRTMLERVVERTRKSTSLSAVAVATSTAPADDQIVAECERLNVPCFRGSENDVLDRYYRAAQQSRADVVVRITADCPLVDAAVMDKVILAFQDAQPDYASNVMVRTYPRGLDTEVFSFAGLERCWRDATLPYQRTHVTPYFYQNAGLFRLLGVEGDKNYSEYRWTVDTPEDLRFVQEIYARLGPGDDFSWTDVVSLLESHPDLSEINRAIAQKSLHEG